jgi:hypothetical protein
VREAGDVAQGGGLVLAQVVEGGAGGRRGQRLAGQAQGVERRRAQVFQQAGHGLLGIERLRGKG